MRRTNLRLAERRSAGVVGRQGWFNKLGLKWRTRGIRHAATRPLGANALAIGKHVLERFGEDHVLFVFQAPGNREDDFSLLCFVQFG